MEKKKKKRKWKDVRSALVMVLVMAAMLSTATYAWFTMTSNPTVTGMQMVASSGTGLTVSNSVNETFVNAVEIKLAAANMNLADPDKRLLQLVPVSLGTTNGTTPTGFRSPEYDANGIVTGLKTSDLTELELQGKVAKYTYYIKSETGNQGVGLIMGDNGQAAKSSVNAANQAEAQGTFVRNLDGSKDNSIYDAFGAIRIGLIVTQADNSGNYGTPNIADLIIIEPNNDMEIDGNDITSANVELNDTMTKPGGGNYAQSDYTPTILPSKVVANQDGTVTTYTGTSSNQTQALFTVSETPKQITMYIWLEGTDSQCVDQIKTDEMEAQIQFVGLGETTTESNVPYTAAP